MKKVSIDFDNTLSRSDVQHYVKRLLADGIDVIITTSRYDEDNKHFYPLNPTNDDMYEITDRLGIKRDNITFTNMDLKFKYLDDSFSFHLDDDNVELKAINKHLPIKGISVYGNWNVKCNRLLK